MSHSITDLHCHILPGIDDGAQDIEMTRALLEEELRQGVKHIVFTPHFYADKMSARQFMINRYKAAVKANPILDELGIEWSAGAEVRLVPELLDFSTKEIARFKYVDTNYLLLEWPFTQYPVWGDQIVDSLLDRGVRPLFAHIERYPYFWNHIRELDEYIEDGCLCQVNPGTLIHESTRNQTLHLIKEGYIHVLSSDAHNMTKRPPRLKEAYDIVEAGLGSYYVDLLKNNAYDILHGNVVHSHLHENNGRKKFLRF